MATNNVINTPQIILGGPLTFSGAFSTTITVTGATNVTLPTAGTLATTTQIQTWTEVTGSSQAAAVNNSYTANNAGTVTFTLPATAAIGSVVAVQGNGAGGWSLVGNTGQTIKMGSSTTSSAGSLSSTLRYDAVSVVCITANTTWAVQYAVGNLTVA